MADVLFAGRQGSLHSFLTDQVDTVQVEVNTSGGAEGTNLRKPFGGTRYGSTSFLFKGFTGQLKDDVPNLVYFNARYYDQDAATFISADSVLPGGGYDLWGLSPYATHSKLPFRSLNCYSR